MLHYLRCSSCSSGLFILFNKGHQCQWGVNNFYTRCSQETSCHRLSLLFFGVFFCLSHYKKAPTSHMDWRCCCFSDIHFTTNTLCFYKHVFHFIVFSVFPFLPFFFLLCLNKVIQSICSLTCWLKPACLCPTRNYWWRLTATAPNTHVFLSPLSLSWAEFKDHQPLVCLTLIRAEQGHTHVSMMSVWKECGSTPLTTVYNSTLCPPLSLVYSSQLAVCSSSSWHSFCPANCY